MLYSINHYSLNEKFYLMFSLNTNERITYILSLNKPIWETLNPDFFNWPTQASFCLFLFFLQDKYSTNLTINYKRVNGELGTRTWGGRMKDTDKSIELYWHPFIHTIFNVRLVHKFELNKDLLYMGSGCDSVDSTLASNTWGPQFESNHKQIFISSMYLLPTVLKILKRRKEGVIL